MFGVRPICAFCRRACPRFTLGDAVLLRRFALGSRPVYGSIVAFCVRSRLLFAACAPNRTACGMLRFYSAGSRSPFVRSRDVGAVICLCGFTSGLDVFLWRSRRDYRGRGERGNGGTRLAARPLYIFARAHWPCRSFRREYAGAARPRLRQRVFDSLDSLHAAAGLCWCVFAAPSPGQTGRPARL